MVQLHFSFVEDVEHDEKVEDTKREAASPKPRSSKTGEVQKIDPISAGEAAS